MNKEQRKILERAFGFILKSANEEQAQKIIDALLDLSKKESKIGKNMTGKEALLDLIDTIKYTHNDGKTLLPYDKTRTDAIMEDLEILEIIINKCVYPMALMSLPYEIYNKLLSKEHQVTQEEYDKIKERLKR